MSDRRRRELERRAAWGGPEAEARLLLERLRAGALDASRLRLLARLGDPLARQVLGGAWPVPISDPGQLVASLRPSANRGLILRVVLAVADLAVEVWEAALPGDPLARGAVSAARAWWEGIEAGLPAGDERALAGAAAEASMRLSSAALEAPRPADSAGRAASEPAVTIAATGGRFLSSAEATATLAASAGVPTERILETILTTVRQRL